MQLILDAVIAKCPGCGHRDFPPPASPLPAGSPLTCGNCGAKVYYSQLAQQAELEARQWPWPRAKR
jgi:DNA-directed RNA polymerase subunit RPC12/RpoP